MNSKDDEKLWLKKVIRIWKFNNKNFKKFIEKMKNINVDVSIM